MIHKCILKFLAVLLIASLQNKCVIAKVMYIDFEDINSVAEYFKNASHKEMLHLSKGLIGNGMMLNPGECLRVIDEHIPSLSHGTIMFWFKPLWGYYNNSNDAPISHTFLSMRLMDNGYLVFSDGWWESKGGGYETYFVLDNKKLLNIHKRIIYKNNQWVNLAISWNAGENGFLRLYVNGKLLVEKVEKIVTQQRIKEIYLGCDKGTTLSNGRWINGVVDEFKIFDKALSEVNIYKETNIGGAIDESILWEWLDSELERGHQVDDKLLDNEKRVIFDSYPGSWKTEQQARETIKKISESGFNVYIPCVWYGDGARYLSKVAPHANYVGQNMPFKRLIEIAHEYDIQVHPWVTVVYRSKDILQNYYFDGTPPNAFEIHLKEYRDFIVNVIVELIRDYDIDGINLDYIRTMGISKSELALNSYKNKFDSSLLVDVHKLDSTNSWNNEVQKFVDYPVYDIVKRVSDYARRNKPSLIISVDGHPIPRMLGKSREGRHEIKWLNEGLIDVVYAMSYSSDLDYERIDLIRNELNDPDKLIVLLGAFDKVNGKVLNRDSTLIRKQIEFIRRKWGNGVGLYPLSMLTDKHLYDLKSKSFMNKANVKWHVSEK